MLMSAGFTMRRLLLYNPFMLVAPGMRHICLALIACAASITLLAQTEIRIATPEQGASASLPADPSAAASFTAPNLGRPTGRFDAAASGFGQSRLQPFALPGASNDNSPQWNRKMLEPFQPGPNFGKFPGNAGVFNRFGSAGIGGRQDRFGSVFQTDGSKSHGLISGEKETHSASPVALPSFSALMRSNRNEPLNTSPGTFKLSYKGMPGPGGDAVDFMRPFGSSVLINSDLGNGVLFSAGTGNGSRPAAGAPAASLGNGTPGAKHSGAAVNLKLSF